MFPYANYNKSLCPNAKGRSSIPSTTALQASTSNTSSATPPPHRSSRPPLRPHVSVPKRMPRCWADYPGGLKRQSRGALPWLSHCPRYHGGGARTALPYRRLRPAWQGVCAPERPATTRETDADDCAFKHGRV